MQCTSCGTENPEKAKFCIECAAPFQKRCPQCATENPPQAKFCAECATSLTPQAKAQSLQSQVAESPNTTHQQRDARPILYTPPHLAERMPRYWRTAH